jgi:acetylornithine deacetylase/succinyl-diaminopimelate desuccinylase-like protein
MSLETVLAKIDETLPEALERLYAILRIPSISTDPAYRKDCDKAADWMVEALTDLGFSATKRPTTGHPMVIGHCDGPAGSKAPHLLFYGHYDVQPADPLALWDRPPFDPALEETPAGPVIRGRGTSDDKGQYMTFLEACRAWKAVHGTLPCKLTIFLEGEEESGSPSLIPFLQANAEELSADLALISDTALFQSRTPAIVTMLRGLMKEEITIHAASRDLHSGFYGGIARNPIRVLSGLLAGLQDDDGRITLPGFYDGVKDLTDDLRAQWEALNFDHEGFLAGVGLSLPAGETGRTPLEMIWSRPSCDITGIWGGYTGEGFKTVLPAEAHAKISFRLVPGQDPEKIRTAFRAYITKGSPADCRVTFTEHQANPASQMAITNPIFETARQALGEEWGEAAAFIGCGGSIPIAGHFKDYLGMDAMLIGFSKDDDGLHSPNEKYDLESFRKGTRSWARILHRLAAPSA